MSAFDEHFASYERRLLKLSESSDLLLKAKTVEEQIDLLRLINRLVGKGMGSLMDVYLTPTDGRIINFSDLNTQYLDAAENIHREIEKALTMT